MRSDGQVRLLSGNANRDLALAIAKRISVYRGRKTALAEATVRTFSDSEIFVEIQDNVRGEDVFVVQSTSRPANDTLMELLIMIDAVRRSSASRITAVIPYFGYARQDRRTAARTPISAKLVANLITQAGADRVLTLDLHAGQIQGFFDIPTDNLYAAPVFALDIKYNFPDRDRVTVVSPDVGGVIRARDVAKRIGADLAIVDKRRGKPGEVEEMILIGSVENRDCIIVDDIVDSAGTLCKAADKLMENGATSVHAYVSHGVLSGSAVERVNNSALRSLVTTDSIRATEDVNGSSRIRVVSIAPLMAQAILNVGNDTSVSSLFSEESLAPLYEAYYGAC
ncbi:MAG: ribose-phosphate pyrophosphokinase [Pseudomonadota bacterium]